MGANGPDGKIAAIRNEILLTDGNLFAPLDLFAKGRIEQIHITTTAHPHQIFFSKTKQRNKE